MKDHVMKPVMFPGEGGSKVFIFYRIKVTTQFYENISTELPQVLTAQYSVLVSDTKQNSLALSLPGFLHSSHLYKNLRQIYLY